MAQTESWGVDSTALQATIPMHDLAFEPKFAKVSAGSKEAIITNTTSTYGREETIRYGYNLIENVYNGTGILPALQSVTKQGVSILAQIRENLTLGDDSDPTIDVVLPFSCHVVLKFPRHSAVTGTHLQWMMSRLLGALCEQGVETDPLAARLNSLGRGILLPRSL